MSPYERMKRWYVDNPQEHSFEFYLDWHLRDGFVFSTPDFFIMGRPIIKERGEEMTSVILEMSEEITNLCDTWYIHAMSGDMRKAWSIMPWPLDWIAFERVREGKRELTIVPSETLKRLCPPEHVHS